MDDECPICCDSYNKSLNTAVKCEHSGCEYTCCKSCIRTYLLGTTSDPHCMNCKKAWSEEFFVKNLNRAFTNNQYKSHRKSLLLDREIARLPETMEAAKNQEKVEKFQEKNAVIKSKIKELREQISNLQHEEYNNEREISNIRYSNKPKEGPKTTFCLPCGNDGCRGFLSTAYKCELCEFYSCPKCLVVIGDKRHNPDHVCDPALVATTELIKNTTKPCPKCGERIQKTDGCDQMWCPGCQTAFSWRTGEIDTGTVHNPHFYEWQRNNNGGVAPRNPGDNCCENDDLPYWYQMYNEINTFKDHINTVDWNVIKLELRTLHRLVTHVRQVDLRGTRRKIRTNTDHEKERIEYLLNRISKEKLSSSVFRKDNLRKKQVTLVHVLELFVFAGTDLFKNLENHMITSLIAKFRQSKKESKKEVAKEAYDYMNNIIDQFRNLIKYFNDQMIMIGITYNQMVPQIQERKEAYPRVLERELRGTVDISGIKYSNFYQNTRKFNTKDYKNVKIDQ